MGFVSRKLSLLKCRREWRKKNLHNYTTISFPVDENKVHVGSYTYGELSIYNNGTDSELYIGSFCSIGPNVMFLLGTDHPTSHLSTYPFKTMILDAGCEAISKGDITIQDDVWLGGNVTVLSGLTIGQGAVVAAGSVVTKNVKPYAVVGGVPARVIKYRFSQEIIEKLLTVDFSKIDEDFIVSERSMLYSDIDINNIDDLMNHLPVKCDL